MFNQEIRDYLKRDELSQEVLARMIQSERATFRIANKGQTVSKYLEDEYLFIEAAPEQLRTSLDNLASLKVIKKLLMGPGIPSLYYFPQESDPGIELAIRNDNFRKRLETLLTALNNKD